MELTRAIKNAMGHAKGFAGCYCCGDTWDWKESHITMYSPGGGMFPLCHECWLRLTPKERLVYYYQLIANWEKDDKEYREKNPGKVPNPAYDYTELRKTIEDAIFGEEVYKVRGGKGEGPIGIDISLQAETEDVS